MGTEQAEDCRVYWGSHGCHLSHGHAGDHACDCCDCVDHERDQGQRMDDDGAEWFCVARPPYYGPDTRFYGDDADHPASERTGS